MPKIKKDKSFYRKLSSLNKSVDILVNTTVNNSSPSTSNISENEFGESPTMGILINETPTEILNNEVPFQIEPNLGNENKTNEDIVSKTKHHDDLKIKLRKWALKWNVPHCAIRDLLGNLKSTESMQEINDLPLDSRTLLKTPRSTTVKTLGPNETFTYFGIEQALAFFFNKHDTIPVPHIIEMSVNIDGVPISNSSGSCLYPILGRVLSSIHPAFSKKIFVLGIYHGYSKPSDTNNILVEFVDEVIELAGNGVEIKNITVPFKIVNFIFDAVAKAQFMKVKGHMGYSSCLKCTDKGEIGERGIYFPITPNSRLRDNNAFRNMTDEGHHVGETLLSKIKDIDLVQDIVLDYMHLICLGVTKKLVVTLWLYGKPPNKFQSSVIEELSNKMISIQSFIPCDFVRKPRSFSEAKRFKATEYRQLLLYTGPIVFYGNIPKDKYLHFLTLHVAIRILCNKKYEHFSDYAENLLQHFVNSFSILYGNKYVSHNVHNLLHLAQDVKRFGPLDRFSAFPFENYLQELKYMIRKAEYPLSQLVKRIKEKENGEYLDITESPTYTFGKIHHSDILINNQLFGNPQYKEVCIRNLFNLQIKMPNNCCGFNNGDIVSVQNFATCLTTNEVCVIGYRYLNRQNLYVEPIESSVLSIFIVSNLSSELEYWNLSDVDFKYMRLPFEGNDVVIPIMHHEK